MVAIGWQGGVVIGTLVVGLITMAGDWVGPDFVFAGMIGVLTAARVITVNQATAGFASSGLLTVVALYVVAEGIGQTGGMEKALNVVLGRTPSAFWGQVRMFIPVMITSAFLNNTPIVALLIPIMIAWGRRTGISPKKLLIPLSYAAVFGGTLTLIGTSTNLVVSSLQEKRYIKTNPAAAYFNFFYITPYGVVYALFGMIYTLIASPFLLPGDDTKRHSDLLFTAVVPPSSQAVNKTVREAGFKRMERLFLVAVDRQGHLTHAVGPDYLLEAGDKLIFSGEVKQARLYSETLGFTLLTSETEEEEKPLLASPKNPSQLEDQRPQPESARLIQASVKKGADVVGRSIKDLGFRGRFNAAVLAIKRGRAQQPGRLGDQVLQTGDILVMLTENKDIVSSKDFKAVFHDVEPLSNTLEKEFLSGMRVTAKYSGVGKSIQDAGLRGIEGLYLVNIERADGERLHAVDPETVIKEGDMLWFCGSIDNIYYVLKISGLEHAQSSQVDKLQTDILHRQLVQVSVAFESGLVGQTVRDAHFRSKYDAAVLAIHRQGVRIPTDVREVRLRAGDVLLLDTGSSFVHKFKHERDFSLISGVPNTSPLKIKRMWIALGLGALMIATQIVGGALNQDVINLFIAAVLTGGLMLLFRCFNGQQARNSIDWRVYVTIAFAFAMSTALEVSGVAENIAGIFTRLSEAIGGKSAAFVAIYVATALLSEIVSNNAAAALMYPIAARLGDAMGIWPSRMSVVVMLGASAGFTLPYSYQTNLMVFAAGDYRFMEFAKFGLPCQLFMVVAVIIIFVLEDKLGIAIALSFLFLAVVLAGPLVWVFLPTSTKLRLTPRWLQSKLLTPADYEKAIADAKL